MKAFFLGFLFVSMLVFSCRENDVDFSPNVEIAAYYFPNYHPNDSRNVQKFGPGWSEWDLVKNAKPRFPGHNQPKVPLWGHEDESGPAVMAKKINTAAEYGIDAFIFDWYYYDDGPFLERCVDSGFMQASNSHRLKFGLMWANHDWQDIHPVTKEQLREGVPVLYPGKILPETWDKMTDMIIEKYFLHSSYWTINNAPYFSIYDLSKFVAIFGSVEGTIKAVLDFRNKTRAAGFSDLHLNAVVWGRTILPSEEIVTNVNDLIKEIGFNSATSYVWVHHAHLNDFPQTEYNAIKEKYFAYAEDMAKSFGLPYYPNVTMGWDSSPRCAQEDEFEPAGYPFTATIKNNTSAAFEKALVDMKLFLLKYPDCNNIFNINCWNEWTEGSYLEPDTVNGYAYLKAIKKVFGQ